MKKTLFEAFFSNLYHASRIIDSRLQVFLRFVIVALTANNTDDAFTIVIATLTTAYTSYFGNYETKNVNIAERIGSTTGLNLVSRLFADTVRKKYSGIASVYPEGTAIYDEFFPKGMTEFSQLTRANIQTVSHRIATKTTQYKATLGGQPFADIFTELETEITSAIGTQNVGKSKVFSITGDVIISRIPVEDALMKAMFKVGDKFWPNQTACRSYFDFSLLIGKNNSSSVVKTGLVLAETTFLCIGEDIVANSVFTLKNKADFPVIFFAAHVVDGELVGVSVTLPAHTQRVMTFAEFGAKDMLFLYIKNATIYSGNWEVRMD